MSNDFELELEEEEYVEFCMNIGKKYNVTSEELEKLTIILMGHGYKYNIQTINLLKAQTEIMEFLNKELSKKVSKH